MVPAGARKRVPGKWFFLGAFIFACFLFWWLRSILCRAIFHLPDPVEDSTIEISVLALLLFIAGYLFPAISRPAKPFTGTMLKGGQTHERSFMINQVPVYVRAGAIVPEYPRVENLKQNPDKIIVRAFPGGGSASRMYEDQGDSLDYQNNGYAFTRFQTVENADGSLTLTVFPREGSYAGMADARSYEIQFPGRFAPSRVSIDGNSMDYSPDSSAGTWSYSGSDLTTHVYVPSTQCINKVTVTVAYAPEALARSADLNGVIGRMARLTSCVRLLKSNWKGPGPLPAMLAGAELTDIKIDYHPAECVQDIEAFLKNYAQLQTELKTLPAAPSVLDEAGHLLN